MRNDSIARPAAATPTCVDRYSSKRVATTLLIAAALGFLASVLGCQTASPSSSAKTAATEPVVTKPAPAQTAAAKETPTPPAEKPAPVLPAAPSEITPEVASAAEAAPTPPAVAPSEDLRLREGDVVQVSFPGAPSLNTQQQVRRDGKITLPIVGDVMAAGLTPDQLKKKLTDLYAPQLVWKEVLVTVVSSQYPVFVSGAVLRPGKILTDRPMTALEAIMEAGGFDTTKANVGAVVVIRNEDGKTKNFTLDMKTALEGRETTPFYLKPSDIVYVPAKFSWF